MPESTDRTHNFHAEATILEGNIELPISQQIEPQVNVKLPVEGGYLSEHGENYRLEEILSFSRAFTHAAGHESQRPEKKGYNTFTTTVVENLNVFEVLTAERVVGQIFTTHPKWDKALPPTREYVPKVSFLGTRFDNLRIAGHPVRLEFDQEIVGPKPPNDAPYITDPGFLRRVGCQYERILKNKDLPQNLRDHYNHLLATLGAGDTVECSLVNHAAGDYPGENFGNIIYVPGFGAITLAKLIVKQEEPHPDTKIPRKTTFTLTMIDLNLGCPIQAMVRIGGGTSNGGGTGG